MNLSDLKIGTRAKIISTSTNYPEFSYIGVVKAAKDTSTKRDFVWITNDDKMGYIISPEHDYFWKVEILK